jgi:DNA-binding transcriptional MerR regulator
MRTIKEIAKLTGISVRTLHYYDEIGLFVPTAKSKARYRLYDDKALETLQQILFFREFDISLKEIKSMMKNSTLDRNQILQMQRKMLVTKKERLEYLIANIDDILKGENKMDFTVFNETEIQTMYESMIENMNDVQRQEFIKQYGSVEVFKEHFLKNAASQQGQKKFAKVAKWYGSKETALAAATDTKDMASNQKQLEIIQQKIADKMGMDVNSFEVQELIREYDFVSKQLFQMKDVKKLMLEMAAGYRSSKELQLGIDSVYGAGFAAYLGTAMEAYYNQ